MIQNVLRTIGGIDVYGIVSLCLFFVVFAAAVLWACAQNRAHLEHMARLPLESDHQNPNTSRLNHE